MGTTTVGRLKETRPARREFLRRISYGGFGGALAGLLNQTSVAKVGSQLGQQLPVPRQLNPSFRDTFDTFDTQRWQIWKPYNPLGTNVEARGGRARVSVLNSATQPRPGAMAYAGFSSKEKIFNSGLKGTNGVEITLVDFHHEGEYLNKWLDIYGSPAKTEDPVVGRYIMGWAITIANAVGWVGPVRSETWRGVQLHWDWMSKRGLHASLVRNILADDFEKYPSWDPKKTPVDEIIKSEFIALPCLSLKSRYWPMGSEARKLVCGHRVRLFLTNDANTVYWTLDGKVMDAHDITGHFRSGKDRASLEAGAYVTIAGIASYQKNIWDFDDVSVFQR